MDGEDLELFRRSLQHAAESRTGSELDAALEELGWADALALDRRAAISTLFELQGRAHAASGALDAVVASGLGLDLDPETGLVWPAAGSWAAPGTLAGSRLRVHGLISQATADAAQVSVVALAEGETVVATVPTTALRVRPVRGADPWLGLHEVTTEGAVLDEAPLPLGDRWTTAVADAHLALAHELVGVSRTMLDLARTHALDRIQFGQPIATFQAVRHRLAETLVAIEMAEALIDAAWLDGSPRSAAMAKALAGREAKVAAKHCQQVLAGIGFTTEHDLHRYIRRALVTDTLFGSATALTADLGAELVTSRQLPPLLPL